MGWSNGAMFSAPHYAVTCTEDQRDKGNIAGQVARIPLLRAALESRRTKRQRPSNWHSGTHLDSAPPRLQPPGKIDCDATVCAVTIGSVLGVASSVMQ